jgi:hypothetical protein
VKPREPRKKVLISARMRLTASWYDVCIVIISSRGMQLQGGRPPERGAYIEIRRGPLIIIGCVAWAAHHRFGIRAQDILFVDAIVADPSDSETQRGPVAYVPAERRAAPRKPASSDRSRIVGRAMEFACFGVIAVAGATALYGAAEGALATPLASVSNALGD